MISLRIRKNSIVGVGLLIWMMMLGSSSNLTAGNGRSAKQSPELIAGYESRLNNLSAKERASLGWHHLLMAKYYDIAAFCNAQVNLQVNFCLSNSNGSEYGADYFAAMSTLYLKDFEAAQKWIGIGKRKQSAPELMRKLIRSQEILITGYNSGWNSVHSSNDWEAREVFSHQALQTGLGSRPPALPGSMVEDNVDFTPLIWRVRLADMFVNRNEQKLRGFLARIEREGMPLWAINTELQTPARIADPLLFAIAAKAHFLLAMIDFSTAAKGASSKSNVRRYASYAALAGCHAMRYEDVKSILTKYGGDDMRTAVYGAWADFGLGNTTVAEEVWRSAEDSESANVITELLRIYSRIPRMKTAGRRLCNQLIDLLGDEKNQAKMYQNPDTRSDMKKLFGAAGYWHLYNGALDTASNYYGQVREKGSLTLEQRGVTIAVIAEYYTARTLSGRWASITEAFQVGWSDDIVRSSYPSIESLRTVIEYVMLCTWNKSMEN